MPPDRTSGTGPAERGAGASALRVPIVAARTQDEGCCIMCATCGHIFAEAVAFSDESQPVDNDTLARALHYHMCMLPRRQPPPPKIRGRIPR